MIAVEEGAVASLYGIVRTKKNRSQIWRMCTKYFNLVVRKLLVNEDAPKQKPGNYEIQRAVNVWGCTDGNYLGLGGNSQGIYYYFERFMIEKLILTEHFLAPLN